MGFEAGDAQDCLDEKTKLAKALGAVQAPKPFCYLDVFVYEKYQVAYRIGAHEGDNYVDFERLAQAVGAPHTLEPMGIQPGSTGGAVSMNNNRNIMCWHGKEAELLSIRLPNVFEDLALLDKFKCFVFKTVSKNRIDREAKFHYNPSTFTWTPYAHKSNVPKDDLLEAAVDKEVFITRDEQGSTNKPLQLLVETAGLGIQIVTHRHLKNPGKTDVTKHIETVICLWIP